MQVIDGIKIGQPASHPSGCFKCELASEARIDVRNTIRRLTNLGATASVAGFSYRESTRPDANTFE